MMLRHESILALVEWLNGDDTRLNCLDIFHSDDFRLWTATTEELPIFIRAASSFVQNRGKPDLFHVTTLYYSAKICLAELRAVLADHHTDSATELAEVFKHE